MYGKGKTPRVRVNPVVNRFDLACVAQTKKDIAEDKKKIPIAQTSSRRIWLWKHEPFALF
jgi:hypothetical protein